MIYPASFTPMSSLDGKQGYAIRFRDIPEVLRYSDSFETAKETAQKGLLDALQFYYEDWREIPMPSAPRKGEVLIELPHIYQCKVLLLNEMVVQNIRLFDLAKMMDMYPSSVSNIFRFDRNTKFETVVKALNCLGKRVTVNVTD